MRGASLLTSVAISALAALPACAAGPSPEDVAAKAKPIVCDQLTTETLGLAHVTIASAAEAPADKGLPAACIIKGAANQRVGVDGKAYALGFEMRLPLAWNGRFLHRSMAAMTAPCCRRSATRMTSTLTAANPRWRAALQC
jgi:hypothetical protein